ncbi:MAG: thiamine-phosphate kinase [SAR86 cluster bacterium]|uniref:Thiamine-monophosphate kinase n=1 Tax=SAR86 cluster bacterium TaxID=2030880 RepID=A0A2A4WVV7_9GAMM|nr:MAG: thiamine-phosphate kinase [SAR86 cluster bacterium]
MAVVDQAPVPDVMHKPRSHSEFEIIRRFFATPNLSFPREGIELGIGDDAALLQVPPNKNLAMSMDVLISGIHFPLDADPSLIANRALAVNLSDLAAMGAEPYCFTLGLVLPHSDEKWLAGFSGGLEHLARQYNCPLVGGDTSRGPLSISIQVQGLVDNNRATRRSGANVGDKIYVSGTLGDGAIALLALGLDSHLGSEFSLAVSEPSAACRQYFEDAYFKPQPQIGLASAAGKLFSSAIDISDGLQGDLQHILDASEVAGNIRLGAIPYSKSAMCCVSPENRLRAALFGGDDYELCFTVAEKDCVEAESIAKALGVSITCIGDINAGEGIDYLGTDDSPVEATEQAFQHFSATT